MIVLKFKAITKLSVFLFIAAFMSSAQAYRVPLIDISGLWEVSSKHSADNSNVQGFLNIHHDVRTGKVTAASTSGGSHWTGTFNQGNRVLKADFKNNDIKGKIYLQFNVDSINNPESKYKIYEVLSGKWFSSQHHRGEYYAYRFK